MKEPYTITEEEHAEYKASQEGDFCSPPGGKDFETALRAQFDADPRLKEHHAGIYRIIQQDDSPHKRRQLRRMERAVRGSLGYSDTKAIDWGNLDWTKIISAVLSVLGAILPFLVALL